MDPDVCLKEMLEIAAKFLTGRIHLADEEQAMRLAELVEALDGWILKEGFLPQRWTSARTTVP